MHGDRWPDVVAVDIGVVSSLLARVDRALLEDLEKSIRSASKRTHRSTTSSHTAPSHKPGNKSIRRHRKHAAAGVETTTSRSRTKGRTISRRGKATAKVTTGQRRPDQQRPDHKIILETSPLEVTYDDEAINIGKTFSVDYNEMGVIK